MLTRVDKTNSNECRPRTCLELSEDWADFLLDDTRPNKERLLSEKRKLKQEDL